MVAKRKKYEEEARRQLQFWADTANDNVETERGDHALCMLEASLQIYNILVDPMLEMIEDCDRKVYLEVL